MIHVKEPPSHPHWCLKEGSFELLTLFSHYHHTHNHLYNKEIEMSVGVISNFPSYLSDLLNQLLLSHQYQTHIEEQKEQKEEEKEGKGNMFTPLQVHHIFDFIYTSHEMGLAKVGMTLFFLLFLFHSFSIL